MIDKSNNHSRIMRNDLSLLIEAMPNAHETTHKFLVPSHLETQMRWAIGKPFCLSLWWETFEGYQIELTHDGDELRFVTRDIFAAWTTCR